ncbi:hypothetical protein RF11_12888 [Thelohanellus kitauei]|uniref:Uncharacterized protein n=1 Tax=Thelohanellus kitauei TaxID=669202 RepID=A0A0C2IX56_THEKT|nr:hypothetical protein RF11_12888 [Thelohanellus kitauei]
MNSLPRTNNNFEGWHRAFSSMESANHPYVLAFLNAIKSENPFTDLKKDTAISITDVQGQRGVRYTNITNQITSIIDDSENLSHSEDFRSISYAFSLEIY